MSTEVKKLLLLLGAGKHIGASVARAFSQQGYSIVYVARSLEDDFSKPDEITVHCDLSKPESVVDVFNKVKANVGIPTVVIHNAYTTHNVPPLDLSLEDFRQSLAINTESLFVAVKESVKAWASLPEAASPTFIYTGNGLIHKPYYKYLDLGAGKAASASIIHLFALENKSKGYKFYFADQRLADGDYAWFEYDADAHAVFYPELVAAKEQGPWEQTFVKGQGYTLFETPHFSDGPPGKTE